MNLDRVIAVRNNKTVYWDGDRCLKVFCETYSKAEVLSEALNHARVEETGLPVPALLEVTMLEGKWAIVTAYVKGKTLARLMAENEEKKEEYIALLARLQREAQKKSCPLLHKLSDKIKRKLADAPLDAGTRRALYARLSDMPEGAAVCHGDFTPSNVIVADDGTPYILDWSHATQGNAAADAARTYLFFLLNGSEADAECYLDAFCEGSETGKQSVQAWLPLIAAALSVKVNEGEREALRFFLGENE